MTEPNPIREQLTFAMGCFWGPEDRFARVPGVTATRVGYCGGDTPSALTPPTAPGDTPSVSSAPTTPGEAPPALPPPDSPGAPAGVPPADPGENPPPVPTHRRLAGHSEAVEVEFDPRIVSLEELLRKFWGEHNPSAIESYKPDDSRYRSILFYRNEEQRAAMERVRSEPADAGRSYELTALRPLGVFYPAEEKHQRYEAKKRQRNGAG